MNKSKTRPRNFRKPILLGPRLTRSKRQKPTPIKMFIKIPLNKIPTNLILGGLIIAAGVSISYSIISQTNAQAQANLNITYPVKELGDCKNEGECRTYCDKPENIGPCVNFAEKNNLLSPEEAARAKAFAKTGTGPGGCKSKNECESYCNDSNNMEACLDFAEKNNFISPDELKEARQVASALREGAKLPGNCRGKAECEAYCDDPSHINECLDFAEKAGFVSGDKLKEARQAAKAISSGITPPGNCRGKKGCDTYCSEPSHMEECLIFAEKAGFIPPEEAERARKIIPLMMRGEMPGGCRGKAECEIYCSDQSHSEECANFAIKAGFMKPEEAEMFKKTGGKGPGSCKGKEECESFCNKPENNEVCFKFAEEHGLIPAEDVQKMKEGMTKMKEGLEMAPSEVKTCLEQAVGTETLGRIRAGTLTPGPQIGDQVRNCFEKSMPQGTMGPGGPQGIPGGPGAIPQGQFRGPGGCSSPDECTKYCSDPSHQEECGKFRGNQSQGQAPMIPQGVQLPEGVRSPEGMMQPPEGQNIPEGYKQMMPLNPQIPGQMLQEFKPPEGANIPQQYQQYQGMAPPQGMEQIQSIQPQQQYIVPPPSGTPPPTETAPPPPQSLLRFSPFGFLLQAFLGQ